MCVAKAFTFFFFLIQKKLNKNKEKNPERLSSSNIRPIETTKKITITKRKLFLWTLLFSFLGYFEFTSSSILKETQFTFFCLSIRGFYIFFSTLISIKKLGYKYYKHHFLAILVIFVGIIIYSGSEVQFNIVSIKTLYREVYVYIIVVILSQFMVAVEECSEKYLMHLKFVSPFLLLSLEGIIGAIMSGLTFIPFSLLDCPNKVYFCSNTVPTLKIRKIEPFLSTWGFILRHYEIGLLLLAVFISMISYESFRILLNQRFSPSHRSIADVAGCFVEWIILLCGSPKFEVWYYIIGFIGYFIIMFGVMVYLEIIILNFCGLNANTDKEISGRAERDKNTNENTVDISLLTKSINSSSENMLEYHEL